MIVSIRSLTLFLCCGIIFTACTDSTFHPRFKVSRDSIYTEIHKIIKSQSISILGIKAPVDDSFHVCLNIAIINAREIPIDKDSITAIQKKIAVKLKSLLKDQSQFKEYGLIFVQRDTTRTFLWTKISEEGLFDQTFNVDELQQQ